MNTEKQPRRPSGGNACVTLATRITPDLYNQLFKIANDKDWTVSQLIRNALEHYARVFSKKKVA